MSDYDKKYAEASWTVEDILARFPAATPESAKEFLEGFERKISDSMIDAGWNTIDALGETEMEWTTSDEDEEEAFDRARTHLGLD